MRRRGSAGPPRGRPARRRRRASRLAPIGADRGRRAVHEGGLGAPRARAPRCPARPSRRTGPGRARRSTRSPRIENSASRTRSAVGRVSGRGGACSRRPLYVPAITRTRAQHVAPWTPARSAASASASPARRGAPVRAGDDRLQGRREDLRDRRAGAPSRRYDQPQVRAGARARTCARAHAAIDARLPPRQAPLEHRRARRLAARRLLRDLVEDSYDLVVSELPRRVQRELGLGAGIAGATVLVTGATDGLGREVARELAARGARVLVHGRSADRARPWPTRSAPPACTSADFSSLAAGARARRRAPARRRPGQQRRADLAGARGHRATGCELTFQVNHLAPSCSRCGCSSAPRRAGRHVASAGQEAPDFGDLMLERGYEPWRAYRQSKLAQIMFAFELAERRPDVESTALHPATFMDTKMVRETIGRPHSTVAGGRRGHRPPGRGSRPRRLRALLQRDPRGGARPDRPRRRRAPAAVGGLRAPHRLKLDELLAVAAA